MSPNLEKPFKIDIQDEKVQLLRKKLDLTTLPDELENVGRDYGVPLADIKRLLARWKDGYDWRKYEAQLNELPQFTQSIEVEGHGTLTVHYVHQTSTVKNAIPLLFVHGWPGSFIEVRKILPLLVQGSQDHPSFHVVALSLPGFGFSSAPTKPGFRFPQYAELCNKLMISLGYNEYVTQGGDWGSLITATLALLYGKKHLKGLHTNFPIIGNNSLKSRLLSTISCAIFGIPAAEKVRRERESWYRTKGFGYVAEQSTQPQTLGYSLADSPVGLLAWIYEKLIDWTDDYKWDDDEVLTWVSMYWFSSAGPAASIRIYYEARSDIAAGTEPSRVPMGYSYFPKEIIFAPLIKWSKAPNLVFESTHAKGGHFAAQEQPELLVGDVRRMFGSGGPAAGVVPGHSGYD